MSTFDEVVNGAKKMFDAAAVKTNELYESSRIHIEKSQLNCKLKEEYEKLGKTCYNMSETGEDMTIAMKNSINKINQLKKEIQLKNDDLNNVNNTVTCSACGASINAKCDYCPKCGAKLS